MCWLLLFTKLSTTYGGSEQELWHTNNFVVTYGQSHALLNSTIWALYTHHHIFVWFVLYHTAVFICFGHYGAGLACVSKVTTWLATCFGPHKNLQPAYSTQEPSYSLLSPDISQVSTCLTQRELNYNCLHSLNRTQPASITVCILGTGVKLWPLDSRQIPSRQDI